MSSVSLRASNDNLPYPNQKQITITYQSQDKWGIEGTVPDATLFADGKSEHD